MSPRQIKSHCTDGLHRRGVGGGQRGDIDRTHGFWTWRGVQVLVWVEFAKNFGVGGVSTRVKTPLLYPHQGYLAKTGLIQQSYRGYFQATTP